MEFKLNINMDNDSFQGEDYSQLISILHNVITKLKQFANTGYLQDINGNTVGSFEITED